MHLFQTESYNPSVSHEISLVDLDSFKKQKRKHLLSHDNEKYCFMGLLFLFFLDACVLDYDVKCVP